MLCLKHAMNRIQSENYKIRTCKIGKIFLSYLDDKIHILDNGFDALTLVS